MAGNVVVLGSKDPAGRAGTACDQLGLLVSQLRLEGFLLVCLFEIVHGDLCRNFFLSSCALLKGRGYGGQEGLTGVSGELGITAGLYDLVAGRDV